MLGYLSASSQPNLENLEKIAQACGVSVGWLAAGEEPPGVDEVAEAKRLREEMAREVAKVKATIEPGSKQTRVTGQAGHGEMKLSDLLTMTARVLESDTVYSPALSANIKAFSAAVDAESQIATLRHENLQMRNSMTALEERMADLENRMASTPGNCAAG